MHRVLDYLWNDEMKDYLGCQPANRKGHIFESLREVRRWLALREKEVFRD